MPIRSHIDLCIFARFIHVRSANIAPEVEQLLETGAQRDAWVNQFTSDLGMSFHEAYHFWQGLRLPFLHRYALLSFRVVAQAFRALDQIEDLHEWDCMLPELNRLSLASRWHLFAPGQVNVIRVSSHTGEGIDLTPLDLLEGSASLAQWQTTVARGDERWSWTHFSRWSKRNPCYTDALEAVMEALDNRSLALRCFIPMVNVAFHTSEPVLTLAYLACLLARPEAATWVQHPEPCNWRELFTNLLQVIPFKADSDCDGQILGSPYHRITENWLGTKPEHPMLTHPAIKWLELERGDNRYILLLDQPGYLDGDMVAEAMRDFAPFTITCFHLRDGRNRIIVTAAGEIEENNALFHGDFWLRSLTLYSAVRRAAGVHFDPESRLCYHNGCPEYEPNYFNAYPNLPEDFRQCKFRERVRQLRSEMKEYLASGRLTSNG